MTRKVDASSQIMGKRRKASSMTENGIWRIGLDERLDARSQSSHLRAAAQLSLTKSNYA